MRKKHEKDVCLVDKMVDKNWIKELCVFMIDLLFLIEYNIKEMDR